MKLVKVLLVLVVAVAMLGFYPQPAAAVMYSYTSGFQVQNLGSSDATIQLKYYTQQASSSAGAAPTPVTTANDTIPALGSKTYFPIQAPQGFTGSVVIASSAPLASIVNLVAQENFNGKLQGFANASYIGLTEGAQTVNLPLLMKGNATITTWFTVQNTGANNASVSVKYSDSATPVTATIAPNASYTFDQGAETHSAKVFAGTLTSDQPVAVVVVQERSSVRTIAATNGFATSGTNAFMPLVNANNSGFVTGIQLQNAGTSASTITLTYTPVAGANNGHTCTETRTVDPGASQTFALYSFAGVAQTGMTTNCVKERFVGGAQVTQNSAGVPVVATVNQAWNSGANQATEGYNSFAPSTVTGHVVMPLIMDRNSGWYTGFTVANVGSNSIHVACTFTGTSYTVSGDLTPGGVLLDIQSGKVASKYVGSGDCKATLLAGQTGTPQIVAVVNEMAPNAAGFPAFDGLLVYEGINIP